MIKEECTKHNRYTRVKVEENGRKAVFRNDKNNLYRVSKIDDCLIKDGLRADYLVSEVGVASVLIELKGCDLDHACKQLIATVERAEVKPIIEDNIGFLVVCSRYPRFDTFVARAKSLCAKRYGAGFHVVCNQRELDIESVVKIDGL